MELQLRFLWPWPGGLQRLSSSSVWRWWLLRRGLLRACQGCDCPCGLLQRWLWRLRVHGLPRLPARSLWLQWMLRMLRVANRFLSWNLQCFHGL